MLVMPQEAGWLGQRLSSSPEFERCAEALGGVAVGREFPVEKIRMQQEYILSLLIWDNLAKNRGANACGQRFDSHFGYVENDDPDAFAISDRGVHFCGIYTGLLRSAFYLADEIFLLRNVVEGFGGFVSKDETDRKLQLFPKPDEIAESEALAARATVIAHPKRVSARDHFAHFLVTFTLYHEFNHAISGHSAFVASRLGLSRLHEYGRRSGEGLTSALHQEVEYTADMGAIETMFDYVNRGAILRRLYPNAPRISALHRIFLIALSVLCAQWNAMNRTFGLDGLHPDPAARWAACLRLYTVFLQSYYWLGGWAWIGKASVKEVGAIAAQCGDMLDMTTRLAEFGEGSDYWKLREPKNHLIRPDDIRDLAYPPIKEPKPYRSSKLNALLGK